jgi:hypothetical protein
MRGCVVLVLALAEQLEAQPLLEVVLLLIVA